MGYAQGKRELEVKKLTSLNPFIGMLMGDQIRKFYGQLSEYILDFYITK